VKIAVDAMGGDDAPEVVVQGAVQASSLPGFEILLVGRETEVRPLLERAGAPANVRLIDAAEVIEMHDQPAQAVRRKKNASMVVCGDLVKSGAADAFVSAGNSGAGLAVALFKLGRIPGIDRPAIASILPSRRGRVVMVDSGANVDCTAVNVVQFAVMGSIYSEEVWGVERPRVGLLNIGEEECKGNELAREAYSLLRDAPIRFVGNVEGPDVFRGAVDVLVCDGFVGNTVLKVGEGVAEFFQDLVKDELAARPWYKIPAFMLRPVLRRIARRTSYEEVGGAPLLGVNGVCIIGHGRSNARAICNAIRFAGEAARHGVVERIGRQIAAAPAGTALV
jgi:glycerol-3-phosphate acyltransferase PlsX